MQSRPSDQTAVASGTVSNSPLSSRPSGQTTGQSTTTSAVFNKTTGSIQITTRDSNGNIRVSSGISLNNGGMSSQALDLYAQIVQHNETMGKAQDPGYPQNVRRIKLGTAGLNPVTVNDIDSNTPTLLVVSIDAPPVQCVVYYNGSTKTVLYSQIPQNTFTLSLENGFSLTPITSTPGVQANSNPNNCVINSIAMVLSDDQLKQAFSYAQACSTQGEVPGLTDRVKRLGLGGSSVPAPTPKTSTYAPEPYSGKMW